MFQLLLIEDSKSLYRTFVECGLERLFGLLELFVSLVLWTLLQFLNTEGKCRPCFKQFVFSLGDGHERTMLWIDIRADFNTTVYLFFRCICFADAVDFGVDAIVDIGHFPSVFVDEPERTRTLYIAFPFVGDMHDVAPLTIG